MRAQECAGEIDPHYRVPLLEGEILHRDAGRADSRVVEEYVQTAERFFSFGKQQANLIGLADVG